jgi:hypothetical protein
MSASDIIQAFYRGTGTSNAPILHSSDDRSMEVDTWKATQLWPERYLSEGHFNYHKSRLDWTRLSVVISSDWDMSIA